MTGTRTWGKHVTLDMGTVKEFFDARVKKKLPYLYNYTNYSDNNPELVLQRNHAEKERLCPLLNIGKNTRVLDIGCGVGRWGETVLSCGGIYTGVDYCQSLLELAEENLKGVSELGRYNLVYASFQDLPAKLSSRFDIILCNGVMMYINDDDISLCLHNVDTLLDENGIFCIKESVSYKDRLTLDNIYSEELTSNYSAIYRSIDEYESLWRKCLHGYEVIDKGDIWEQNLKNRAETGPYFWVMKKGGGRP